MMTPKHDTKFHVPVGGVGPEAAESPGVSVCEMHHESFREVFGSFKSYMSRSQMVWTIGVLTGVAVFYGVTLWSTVSARCAESEARIEAIKERATIQQVKLEYIEETVRGLKCGQEAMSKEMRENMAELRKEIGRLNTGRQP